MYFILFSDIDNVESEETFEPATKDVQLMAKIVLKLICDGKYVKLKILHKMLGY